MTHIWLEPGEIRQRRINLGLSQQRLAELSGLAIRTIVRLESGENKRGGTTYTMNRVLGALEAVESELSSDSTRSRETMTEDDDARQ